MTEYKPERTPDGHGWHITVDDIRVTALFERTVRKKVRSFSNQVRTDRLKQGKTNLIFRDNVTLGADRSREHYCAELAKRGVTLSGEVLLALLEAHEQSIDDSAYIPPSEAFEHSNDSPDELKAAAAALLNV